MAHSKRYLEAKKMVEEDKAYSLKEAIDLLKAMPKAKFDQTIEICGKLGADPKQSEQMVRGSVVLPHGTGKQIKILVFVNLRKKKMLKMLELTMLVPRILLIRFLKKDGLILVVVYLHLQ